MISIIIPVLNEEETIAGCIEELEKEELEKEIIVSDGGSSDSTVQKAEAFKGVRIVRGSRGRGIQMNRGASVSKGDILLFLHSDTVLEKGWSRAIIESLNEKSVVGGAFAFRVDSNKKRYRLSELWVRLRCGIFCLPYGDQGIFVRRDVFQGLDGFKEIPIMEDVDLIKRLKRIGRIALLSKNACTSVRKWEKDGWISRSILNQVIMILYILGVSPHRLVKLYYKSEN